MPAGLQVARVLTSPLGTRLAPVPRLQIATVEQAMSLRERTVQLPAGRENSFKRSAREEDARRQSALDL